MYIIGYDQDNDSMDICFEGENVHLSHEDLAEYEQIIRDYCP